MSLTAPFPYFVGKRNAAPIVWSALGDVGGYVEPFAGSAAVLLGRPAFKGRRVETLNDADGWLVNAWRSIKLSPEKVAEHAHGPVTEIDYHARLAWLQQRRTEGLVSWLEGDPEHHDPKAAAWWLYVCACGIGDPWNPGPWRVIDGHLTKTTTDEHGVNKELPHLGDAGQGINRALPHLGDAGQGINRALPHLGNAGQGINRLTAYMQALAERLERVRITAGDWKRVVANSVTRATAGNGKVGIFLDPPYEVSGDLYASTNSGEGYVAGSISAEVRDWCATNAPKDARVVLAGYESEHDALLDHGWTRMNGKSGGGAGYSTDSGAGKRERLWLSPACITDQGAFDLEGIA